LATPIQEVTPKVVAMAVITAYGPFDCKNGFTYKIGNYDKVGSKN
jgi:hypothetical protein